jgi:predicted NodU family carbamoyl transferase
MVTLGLFEGPAERAAALVDDGRLIAGCRTRVEPRSDDADDGGDPVERCLHAAGISAHAIGTVITVDDSDPSGSDAVDARIEPWRRRFPGATHSSIHRLEAQVLLTAAAAPTDALIVVANEQDGAIAEKRGGRIERCREIHGMADIGRGAGTVAAAIGSSRRELWNSLGHVAWGGHDGVSPGLAAAIGSVDSTALRVNVEAVSHALDMAMTAYGSDLSSVNSPRRDAVQARAALAGGFLSAFTAALVGLIRTSQCATGLRSVAIGGTIAASAYCSTELETQFEDIVFAPVPEHVGAAIGAAFAGHEWIEPASHLALGPAFDDQAIKNALDNCRLIYVYEPDWSRLFARVSRVLSEGMTVGWFQGPMDFGRRSLGSRSVLCDPSSRWARENVNVFLRRRPAADPIPLSVAPSAADECVGDVRSPFMLRNAAVKADCRGKVIAALDERLRCTLHTPTAATAPELTGLLETHHRRHAVPGLLNVAMETGGGHLAETPNEAIRFAFGSAVDMLVIGRFVVSKDFWLLRGRAD